MDKVLLVVLQNPYDKGELKVWNPSVWRKEFESSRSGQRLLKYLPTRKWHVRYANANPSIGKGPDSKHPASPAHLKNRLKTAQPAAVLACGEVAREVKDLWSGPLFCIPHPASRVLSNLLIEGACRHITDFGIFHDNPILRQAKKYDSWEVNIVRTLKPRLQYIQTKGDYKVVDLTTGKEYGDTDVEEEKPKRKRRASRSAKQPAAS